MHMGWSVGYPPMLFAGQGFVQMVDFNAKMEDFDDKILDVKNLIKESSKVSLDNQKKIDISRKNQIRGDVIELRRKECAASGDYQVILQTQLSELQDEWHTLSKSDLKIPSCGDVK